MSSFSMHGKAGAVSFASFRRASATTLKQSSSSVNTSVAACCLQCGTFFCSLCNRIFLLFLHDASHILSGLAVFWICVGLRFTHLSLVRKGKSLIIFFRGIVETRLSLSHFVDLFQCDRECFIIWAVQLQTRFFMMSINKFFIHGPRIFCCSSISVAFFAYKIIFWLEVSLCYQ